MNCYGIIGNPLDHSNSPEFFNNKFKLEGLDDLQYLKFELNNIDEFPSLIKKHPGLKGVNVTSPFKESVMKYLDKIDKNSKFIGASNVIKIKDIDGKKILCGFNTDSYGFEETIRPFLGKSRLKALLLGTGGGSKAVEYVFRKHAISYEVVTRRPLKANQIVYWALSKEVMDQYQMLVNATSLGMHPHENEVPMIPFEHINKNHIAIDLIYNPGETLFLGRCREAGARTINGEKMFKLQAEKTWEIWSSDNT